MNARTRFCARTCVVNASARTRTHTFLCAPRARVCVRGAKSGPDKCTNVDTVFTIRFDTIRKQYDTHVFELEADDFLVEAFHRLRNIGVIFVTMCVTKSVMLLFARNCTQRSHFWPFSWNSASNYCSINIFSVKNGVDAPTLPECVGSNVA